MKKIVVISITALFFLLSVYLLISALPAAEISDRSMEGLQLRSQVWSGTITLKEDVHIMPWATLTIKPGTKILFKKKKEMEGTDWTQYADTFIKDHNDPTGKEGYNQAHYELWGKINAIGTKEAPIIFTSAQENKEYADWDQLILLKGSRLEYVDVSYAHNGVNVDGGYSIVKNSKIHDSLWSCIDIFSTNNILESNEVYHCWHQGIGVKVKGSNTIRNNIVHDTQLSVNCENGADPRIMGNIFIAAPLNTDCGTGVNNTEENREPDTQGGTYNNVLVYPSINTNSE